MRNKEGHRAALFLQAWNDECDAAILGNGKGNGGCEKSAKRCKPYANDDVPVNLREVRLCHD